MRRTAVYTLNLSIVLIVFLTGYSKHANAQDENTGKPFSDVFDINNPFEMDLIFDIKDFVRTKDVDEYVDAKIAYNNAEGTRLEKNVRIRSRGNVRKKKCYLPPIRIDFNDDDYEIDLFNDFGKVKLVSKCQLSSNHEQYLIKEYLSYKIYESITDVSFKTYSLKINFIDSKGKKKPFSSYSFIIEDIDRLAERNNAVEIENNGLLPVHLDRPTMNTFSMYQYLISNVDWYIPNLHNVKLIKSLDHKKPQPQPVPYDLDYCGLVNTNYSVVHERYPIEKITERYWIGNCMVDEEYEVVAALFLEKKDEVLKIWEECEFLDKFNKNAAIKYINQFYTLLEKGNQSKYTIMQDCK
jgi:hypothetical protein